MLPRLRWRAQEPRTEVRSSRTEAKSHSLVWCAATPGDPQTRDPQVVIGRDDESASKNNICSRNSSQNERCFRPLSWATTRGEATREPIPVSALIVHRPDHQNQEHRCFHRPQRCFFDDHHLSARRLSVAYRSDWLGFRWRCARGTSPLARSSLRSRRSGWLSPRRLPLQEPRIDAVHRQCLGLETRFCLQMTLLVATARPCLQHPKT